MTNKERPEVLQKIEEFEAKLAALGVTADKIPEVSALLGERSDLQADLEHYRGVQFYDDAQDLYYKTVGQRNSKSQITAAFLREFAEHIAASVVGREGTVTDLVDQIPAMHTDDQ